MYVNNIDVLPTYPSPTTTNFIGINDDIYFYFLLLMIWYF
jgi:hypothetical protein